MYPKPVRIYGFILISSALSLSACGSGDKQDEALGRLITDCQMSAHYAMTDSTLTDEKKHVAIGEYVERCLREGGLQPQTDESCTETPQSPEDGKSFVKPLKKCWKFGK
ncbi:MAG: hypothetical protein AB7F41_06995 [Methylocystis sp.]|uniref:hypothetical protein n=1 Tax=Methylocystis sp. TaxID=1911079 RepID=UPI003D12AA6B